MTFATKEEALDALECARADWLASARAWAKAYAKDGRVITINDVSAYGPPLPGGIDPRVRGAVFNEKGVWENFGYGKSSRRISHQRPVARFRLR